MILTSVYNNEISIDTWNLPKIVSETCNSLIKKVWNIQIFLIYKKGKTLRKGGRAHLTTT